MAHIHRRGLKTYRAIIAIAVCRERIIAGRSWQPGPSQVAVLPPNLAIQQLGSDVCMQKQQATSLVLVSSHTGNLSVWRKTSKGIGG